jgi:hypothetical protein
MSGANPTYANDGVHPAPKIAVRPPNFTAVGSASGDRVMVKEAPTLATARISLTVKLQHASLQLAWEDSVHFVKLSQFI